MGENKQKRRWHRFSLRFFLIVVTFLGFSIGWYVNRAEQQRKAVKWVLENGGRVCYDFELDSEFETIERPQPPGPDWLRAILGIDYFSTVYFVNSDATPVDDRPNHFDDLRFLTGMKQVRVLYLQIDGNQASDLTPIAGLKNLEDLNLDGTQVRDLTPLASLMNLQSLNLENTQVSELTPLAGLMELTFLRLDNTHVSNLTPISELVNLVHLSLYETQVLDLTPLAGLLNLKYLDLAKTQVRDVTPLGGQVNLLTLSLFDTQVSDVTPLDGLAQLENLDLRGARVTNSEIDRFRKTMPTCDVVTVQDFQ